MLAGLVASPTKYAPHRNMALARERQKYVLGHMREDEYITDCRVPGGARRADRAGRRERPQPPRVAVLRRARPPDRDPPLRQPRPVQGRPQVLLHARHRGCRARPRARCAAASRRSTASSGSAGRSAPSPQAAARRRGPAGRRTRSPAAATTPRRSPTQLLPEQTLRRDDRRAAAVAAASSVDLGPRRLPLVDADARDVRAWRPRATEPGATGAPVRLGDLLPVRLAADGATATLAQRPALQGAMIVLEPATGRVRASVGGYDWTGSQFNRATQAQRQVGSSIKPFIYAAALESGKTPVDRLDRRAVLRAPPRPAYGRPRTTPTATWATVTLMTALAYSLNTISVQLVVAVRARSPDRDPARVRRRVRRSRATSRSRSARPDLTLLEIAAGYAGIASGGRRVTPRFFDLVTDTSGRRRSRTSATQPPWTAGDLARGRLRDA